MNGLIGLDRAAYSLPARGTFGTAARNTQPGFGINNWDMSLAKNFPVKPLGEAGKLQLRFEWFNLFNHTQFRNPNSTFNTPTFGLVTAAFDPRNQKVARAVAIVPPRPGIAGCPVERVGRGVVRSGLPG